MTSGVQPPGARLRCGNHHVPKPAPAIASSPIPSFPIPRTATIFWLGPQLGLPVAFRKAGSGGRSTDSSHHYRLGTIGLGGGSNSFGDNQEATQALPPDMETRKGIRKGSGKMCLLWNPGFLGKSSPGSQEPHQPWWQQPGPEPRPLMCRMQSGQGHPYCARISVTSLLIPEKFNHSNRGGHKCQITE